MKKQATKKTYQLDWLDEALRLDGKKHEYKQTFIPMLHCACGCTAYIEPNAAYWYGSEAFKNITHAKRMFEGEYFLDYK